MLKRYVIVRVEGDDREVYSHARFPEQAALFATVLATANGGVATVYDRVSKDDVLTVRADRGKLEMIPTKRWREIARVAVNKARFRARHSNRNKQLQEIES